MRFPVETAEGQFGNRIARLCVVLLASTALAACSTAHAPAAPLASTMLPANGPQSDYPITIGQPYTIGETTYRPADTLNYDEVGFATAGTGSGITGAHHTLPVPAYVEVTSLETGRTILVRLETRGPMDSNKLVALSPGAMAQLGATGDTPVRVRRVNPPENQRALLRSGEQAPQRMDTPQGLVEVLRRRLPNDGSASVAGGVQPVESQVGAPAAEPALAGAPVPVPHVVEDHPPVAVAVVEPAPLATSAHSVPAPIEVAEVEPSTVAGAFAVPELVRAGPIVQPVPEPAPQPAQEAEPTPAPVIRAAANPSSGWVVQAGAFSVAANAQRAASQIGGEVSHSGNLYRVRTGPFASRSEAEASLANVRAAGYSDARIYNGG